MICPVKTQPRSVKVATVVDLLLLLPALSSQDPDERIKAQVSLLMNAENPLHNRVDLYTDSLIYTSAAIVLLERFNHTLAVDGASTARAILASILSTIEEQFGFTHPGLPARDFSALLVDGNGQPLNGKTNPDKPGILIAR